MEKMEHFHHSPIEVSPTRRRQLLWPTRFNHQYLDVVVGTCSQLSIPAYLRTLRLPIAMNHIPSMKYHRTNLVRLSVFLTLQVIAITSQAVSIRAQEQKPSRAGPAVKAIPALRLIPAQAAGQVPAPQNLEQPMDLPFRFWNDDDLDDLRATAG